MPKKIIKFSNARNIQSYSFKTFSSTEKGVKSFLFKDFATSEGQKEPAKDDNPKTDSKPLIDEKILKEAEKSAFDRGFKEGFDKGKAEGIAQQKSKYEADKKDYMSMLSENLKKVVAEISEIRKGIEELDENLPGLIIGFVTEIIGTERRINDKLIESVVKNILSQLKEYSDITFIVSPEDKDIVEGMNLGYDIETDPTVVRGGLKVKTNIGMIDFSIDTLVKEFKERINEEFKGS
ncbi:MAG: flagellar assembly protein FliH [Deferribacteres bacterium]|jgi:flagellar assembly protein FliH|nr:fliH [Deferribacteraceae bacterium]MDK2793158.1 flagellar assembly protein FliH [Deferribacteres bacterium]